jgi:hypothetical protein
MDVLLLSGYLTGCAISAPMFSLKGPSMVKATYPTCLSMYSAAENSFLCIWTDLNLSS